MAREVPKQVAMLVKAGITPFADGVAVEVPMQVAISIKAGIIPGADGMARNLPSDSLVRPHALQWTDGSRPRGQRLLVQLPPDD